jgi:hypothetical protein
VTTPQIFARTRGPITTTAHEAGRNTKIESWSDHVFVEIVTESEIYHICKAVLLTIKVAVHNISRVSNS